MGFVPFKDSSLSGRPYSTDRHPDAPWNQLFASLSERNAIRYSIPIDSLIPSVKIRSLSDSLWRRFFFDPKHGRMYEDLYKVYPGGSGLLLISRIGFDSSKGYAILYMEHWEGLVAGYGEFILFRRMASGAWMVVDTIGTWVS
jgi:hypothetical protein